MSQISDSKNLKKSGKEQDLKTLLHYKEEVLPDLLLNILLHQMKV